MHNMRNTMSHCLQNDVLRNVSHTIPYVAHTSFCRKREGGRKVMKRYTKTYGGYTFDIVGSEKEGYEVGYNGMYISDVKTMKEAEDVIQKKVNVARFPRDP